jgi:hypothetical protein
MGEKRYACRILVGKPEGERELARPSYRWEDNIKMDLRKWDGVVWTGYGPVEGSCEHGNEHSGSVKC